MKKTVLRLALFTWLAALAFFVTSCSDYDNGYTEKDIEYGKDFEGIFGNADSKQDWSMAKLVKANVSVSGSSIEIYSGAPVIATSKLLVSTKLGDSSVAFNVVDGIEQVYAVVRNGKGETVVQGFYDIEDGAVNITANPLKKKTARGLYTRAASDVTKGEVVKDVIVGVENLYEEKYFYDNKYYTLEELREWAKGNSNLSPSYYVPFNSDCVIPASWDFTNATLNESNVKEEQDGSLVFNGVNYTRESLIEYTKENYTPASYQEWAGPFKNCVNPVHVDFTNATVDTNSAPLKKTLFNIDFTYLNGVEKQAAEPWTLSVGKQIFGIGTFFEEYKSYNGEEKLTLYGSTDTERREVLQKIESGFSITTTGGEIDMPFVYGATGVTDMIGYVYYKDGEDPMRQPHYVLMNDATPQANIFFDGWGSAGTPVTPMQLAGWSGNDEQPLWGKTADTQIYGTKYKLAFFGENHNQTATYKFPEDYHIVFFVYPSGSNGFNYSLPELNARLGHYYGYSNQQQGSDTSRGAVKAVAWEADGITALGFEDSTDDDLNDIVFWLEGEFEADQEIVKVEVATNNESESWVFACEDLGGSFDYDFNDVVWDVYKEYKTTTTTTTENGVTTSTTVKEFIGGKVRLLAAGGTLPVELYYNEKCLGNVHELFGQQPVGTNLYHQVNVGTKADIAPVELLIPDLNITAETDINDIKSNFKVKVMGESGTSHFVIAPDMSSTAPQIILLPGEWEWPRENVAITDAYPEFTSWVQDKTWTEWAENQVSYNTVSRSKVRNTTISGGDSGNAGNDSSGPNDTNNNEGGNSGTTELKEPELSISSEISWYADYNQRTENIGTNSDGTITYTCSDKSVVDVVLNGKQMQITPLKAGEATITVRQEATSTYKAAEKTMTVTVLASDPNLQIDGNGSVEMNKVQGSQYKWFSTSSKGTVNAVSNDESVVTVYVDDNNVVFTPKAAGSTTVTVTQEASGLYDSATKTITVTVTDNNNNSGGGNSGTTELKDPGLVLHQPNIIGWFGVGGFYNAEYAEGSDAEISVVSSNEGVVTAEVVEENGKKKIKLTGKGKGEAEVTVSLPATSEYKAASGTIKVVITW
ncbi:MAG: DUF4842 domain-containing protein [Bacteroidaceae bacterium]|nr:DUF4842 domain-containing protein [Bacteroidaceae bacterium]